ncbi:hypothetical protein halTADL_1532 [Halohasta litchfieldiae]|jgi:hypothetical protein|uniref:Phage derived protein Gp49-like n=1 Tax=Halohasta litchfieldiae TaxID=1073996 RepID=A0A1H6XRH1_9EURY|nr:hypothetical protein [Halohasta litchfieldiae]ATW88295.1 hypothetical protein halTADL_1532 [Halohasta litchfieldiae]SEJ27492.1 hypothetical protein SAMN05444271_13828 [Halohasta litchfieldiae]
MGEIENVELVEKWVFRDLSSSAFSTDEKRRVLDDLDEMEEKLVTWDRSLHKCVDQLRGFESVTVYRRRAGDLRSYLIRDGATLYCIGVGKRKKTYDRDLSTIQERATEHSAGQS